MEKRINLKSRDILGILIIDIYINSVGVAYVWVGGSHVFGVS